MTRQDLTEKPFGLLTVIGFAYVQKKKRLWWCQCSCPAQTIIAVRVNDLNRGATKSCGCRQFTGRLTHGYASSSTYVIWAAMLQRCNNPRSTTYPRYGGRGIRVCKRWHVFESFLADMGERPTGHTLDRFPDCRGDYEPGNCRWATPRQQANNCLHTRMLTYDGVTKGLSMWAFEMGMPREIFWSRKLAGWDDTRILTTPYTPRVTKIALCHPERPHHSKNLCSACYVKERRRRRKQQPPSRCQT